MLRILVELFDPAISDFKINNGPIQVPDGGVCSGVKVWAQLRWHSVRKTDPSRPGEKQMARSRGRHLRIQTHHADFNFSSDFPVLFSLIGYDYDKRYQFALVIGFLLSASFIGDSFLVPHLYPLSQPHTYLSYLRLPRLMGVLCMP